MEHFTSLRFAHTPPPPYKQWLLTGCTPPRSQHHKRIGMQGERHWQRCGWQVYMLDAHASARHCNWPANAQGTPLLCAGGFYIVTRFYYLQIRLLSTVYEISNFMLGILLFFWLIFSYFFRFSFLLQFIFSTTSSTFNAIAPTFRLRLLLIQHFIFFSEISLNTTHGCYFHICNNHILHNIFVCIFNFIYI